MRFPLFLDLSGRDVLVVGGGAVAARRTRALREAGARVVVVAPDVATEVEADDVRRREFRSDDVAGMWLVVAATDSTQVNTDVATAAEGQGIWCVRSDDAMTSPAWMAAVGRVDDVEVAVSAGGDPGRAGSVRDAAVRSLTAGEWQARRTRRGNGRVVLVGGGPGDPGLLTLAGYRALLDADVVVTDRLGPSSFAEKLPAEVEVVDVGKDPRGHAASQDDINTLLVDRAKQGQTVVRLKGGDPFILGRGSEEVAACAAAGVPVDVIPGVSSVTAAAALAGIPLTRRGTTQEFTVASGHVPPGDERSTVDWELLGRGNGTLVLLMAVANLRPIAAALMAAGRPADTPVAIVENASLPDQRALRASLADAADVADAHDVVPPAVVVVGDVADAVRVSAGDARP